METKEHLTVIFNNISNLILNRGEFQSAFKLIVNDDETSKLCVHLDKARIFFSALAGVAQWIECEPANQRVAGSIPSQGTCLGCGPGPQQGALERQPHTDVSLTLFLPPFPPLKINT